MNQFAVQIFSHMVAAAYLMGASVLISCSYCLIRFAATLNPFVLLWMLVVILFTAVSTVLLVTKAIRIRILSEASYTSFQKLDFSNLINDRFWKSCRPLKIRVGSFGSIETHEYILILFGDVVLKTMVTLLLSTR